MQQVVLAGTFEHTIDDKGRVTLPAKYRGHFEELAILARMPGKERAVRVYTREGWEGFEERNIERLDEFNNAEDRRLQRAIFANLSPVTPDKQGRVLVPASFVQDLGLTGKVSPYKKDAGPFPADIFRAPMPDARTGVTVDDALRALEMLFLTDAQPDRVAAIIIEPVQGEGGYIPVPFEMLRALRAICDRHGILLIADEIQAGFGRTGAWFAIEHSGVVPDLVTVAKSMAGGYPLAGVIGRAEVMDSVAPGGLGGTYGGNPVACAAALAAIDAIEGEGLLARATAMGETFRTRLSEMGARTAPYRMWDIRGLGAMLAVEFVTDFDTAQPDAALAKSVITHALGRGLILLGCGMHGNAVRIMVPLTASDALIDEGLDLFEAALADAIAAEGHAA